MEIEILIRKHRIDDLTKRLILQDYEQQNDPDLRSPSPEPTYDNKSGLRNNTREMRFKDKYMKERHFLITEVILMDKTFIPPSDYKPPKKHKKIFIPKEDDPLINYIG
jgi:splicing factor 1